MTTVAIFYVEAELRYDCPLFLILVFVSYPLISDEIPEYVD